MKYEPRYFSKLSFTEDQIKRNFDNALKDLNIAQKDSFLEVIFTYAYSALIKGGIALLSYHGLKARSVPGHHIKIIDEMAVILKDKTIADMGHLMRSKRNLDFYSGGIEVTSKECQEYVEFVSLTLDKIKAVIKY